MDKKHDLIIYGLTNEEINKISEEILPIIGAFFMRVRDHKEGDENDD